MENQQIRNINNIALNNNGIKEFTEIKKKNKGGRPKGSKNTIIHKHNLTAFGGKTIKFINEVLDGDDKAKKWQVIKEMLPYIFAKVPAELRIDSNIRVEQLNYSKMSIEELVQLRDHPESIVQKN